MPDKIAEQTANPTQGAELFQQETPATSPAEDTSASYESIKGDDGAEYVKIPKTDYEEMRNGVMRMDDYTRKTQTVQTLADVLGAAFEQNDTPKSAEQAKPQQAPQPQKQVDLQALQNVMQSMTREQVQQVIKPLVDKISASELEKEETAFKAKYAQVFSGDPKKDNVIMNTVFETALKYRDPSGAPIPLEQAFFLAYGGNMLGSLQKMYESQQSQQKDWGTESSGLTQGQTETYRSSEEADLAVEKLIRDRVGY